MLYLTARARNRAAVCLRAAHIAISREFRTDWLPTVTSFLPQKFKPSEKGAVQCTAHDVIRRGSAAPCQGHGAWGSESLALP